VTEKPPDGSAWLGYPEFGGDFSQICACRNSHRGSNLATSGSLVAGRKLMVQIVRLRSDGAYNGMNGPGWIAEDTYTLFMNIQRPP
jgi:hypothetical protein